jgi:N-alpha-acetyl-L-2,4-diaminobutyrate deacetylase
MRQNPITPTIDLEAEGVQHGHLKLPHSSDDSAWGAIMIPITVVRSGAGPTALLTGGNHGDEYEGPVALFDLTNKLRPEEVTGRVIIVPAMNYPAFLAARRTSPIDGGNMNRVFPGRPDGGVTEKIADYFQRTLLPLADYVLDFHSGGKTLDFIPFAASHVLPDKAQQAACLAARDAFNAPYSCMLIEQEPHGLYDNAAEEAGKVFVSTELGGGGVSSATTNAIAKRGARNFLIHAGILAGRLESAPSRVIDMPDSDCFIVSEHSGLIEMMVELGQAVSEGALLARVHDIERCGTAPVDYFAPRSGLLLGRRHAGLTRPGDTLCALGVPINRD